MDFKDGSLYLVTSEEFSRGRPTSAVAEGAIAGGIDVLQMREKRKTRAELFALGNELLKLCREKGITFLVNDDPVLAKELGADGVHLGQGDLKVCPLNRVRDILGKKGIIGVSTHSVRQFEEANENESDYIAFGPVFETKSKDFFIGTDSISAVMKTAKKPVVFIGGINMANVDDVLARGAINIAVIRAITEAEDITASARGLKMKIEGNN